jgi:acyl-CoA synthetase (NDP forming)
LEEREVSSARLAEFFRPRNIALIGASDRSAWSHMVFGRFAEYGHQGSLFAVNRNGAEAHGLTGYKRCADIPERVDAAYIYVPAATVADALREAAAAGARNAVVLSSGFAEAGEAGATMQAELAALAADAGVALLGPNSLGFANLAQSCCCTTIRPRTPLRTGGLALVSQSGGVANELSKWAHAQGIGLSFLCATGNEAQISVADVVDYLVDDDSAAAIAIYVEGINHPERLMRAAERARRSAKPIVIFKMGRGEVSRAVALAHTGTEVGDDSIFEALCRRFAVTRANSIEELVATADFLGKSGPIDPPRVGMASVSGGSCGMYSDLAHLHGLAMPPFAPQTNAALRAVLPPFAATLNPLDVTGLFVQRPELWSQVIATLIADPGLGMAVCGLVMPNTPEELAALKAGVAAAVEGFRAAGRPPVMLSYSLQDVSEIQLALRDALGLEMVLPNIELGVKALAHLQTWSERLADTG